MSKASLTYTATQTPTRPIRLHRAHPTAKRRTVEHDTGTGTMDSTQRFHTCILLSADVSALRTAMAVSRLQRTRTDPSLGSPWRAPGTCRNANAHSMASKNAHMPGTRPSCRPIWRDPARRRFSSGVQLPLVPSLTKHLPCTWLSVATRRPISLLYLGTQQANSIKHTQRIHRCMPTGRVWNFPGVLKCPLTAGRWWKHSAALPAACVQLLRQQANTEHN